MEVIPGGTVNVWADPVYEQLDLQIETVLFNDEVFPAKSVAVYVMIYVPTEDVFTVSPEIDTFSPPSELAPNSLYTPPISILIY